jgi:hypothetical protein
MKLSTTILAAICLSVTFGCRGDAKPEPKPEPKRFECIERIAPRSSLYRDTETGEIWIRTVGGGFSTDAWTRIENPVRIPSDKN